MAMSGEIIDTTVAAASRQRNTDAEKAILKAGELPQDWKDKPKTPAQKDREARWTIKYSKAKTGQNGLILLCPRSATRTMWALIGAMDCDLAPEMPST
ncbi:hypothetical protein A0U92_13945 [Acetobacter aceti]|uniref:Uncharacterized protein n=1 Tax=Acetobacter aceti TaxID=435 RepID=A0A1U9KIY0_ACEAC|nr:hypothetical protein A0U92_13945 [Acetobacter aceti]